MKNKDIKLSPEKIRLIERVLAQKRRVELVLMNSGVVKIYVIRRKEPREPNNT